MIILGSTRGKTYSKLKDLHIFETIETWIYLGQHRPSHIHFKITPQDLTH